MGSSFSAELLKSTPLPPAHTWAQGQGLICIECSELLWLQWLFWGSGAAPCAPECPGMQHCLVTAVTVAASDLPQGLLWNYVAIGDSPALPSCRGRGQTWLVLAEPVPGGCAWGACHLSLVTCQWNCCSPAWPDTSVSVWRLLHVTRGRYGQVFMALTLLWSRGGPKPFSIPGHPQPCKGLAGLV